MFFKRISLIALVALTLSACQPRVDPAPLDAGYAQYFLKGRASGPGAFRISGLSSDELAALRGAAIGVDDWRAILRVSVRGQDGPPMAGRYEATSEALLFRPAFPPDAGRDYVVRVDASRPPLRRAANDIFEKTISMPAAAATAPTVVAGLWPS